MDCQIIYTHNSPHLQQIFAGFEMLSRNGEIKLTVKKEGSNINAALLEVIVNNQFKVIYDVLDGFNFSNNFEDEKNLEILDEILKKTDFYFKRSYSSSLISKLNGKNKVYPLGFNYNVSLPKTIFPRYSKSKQIIRKILSFLNNGKQYIDFFTNDFECNPIINSKPVIVFFARAWNPKNAPNKFCSENWYKLNEMRANCIRKSRKEFGANFYGGFEIDDFSKNQFSDCLINNKEASLRANYINIMKSSRICIATTGLYNSIGWKFGEYIAASKAIVSEKLHYEVPGNFKNGVNYLEFSNANECVEVITKLLKDDELCLQMMNANQLYYQQSLRPDRLILNTLNTVNG